MSISNSFKWVCALALLAGHATADLIIDNQTIPSTDIETIYISPASGDLFINTTPGYTVTRAVVGGDVAITGFSASPTSFVAGQSTTLSWSSQNATACSGSGGFGTWPGSLTTSGSTTVTTSAPGSYTFTLTCSGDVGDPVSQSRTVTVTTEPVVGNCDASSLIGETIVEWAAQFGFAFPEPTYSNQIVIIPRQGYYGVRLMTPTFATQGSLLTIEETSTTGRRLGAVSKCPGDFNVAQECKYVWGTGGGILWSTDSNAIGRCVLEQGTQYYWNVTFTDGVDPGSTECGSSRCNTKLRVIHK